MCHTRMLLVQDTESTDKQVLGIAGEEESRVYTLYTLQPGIILGSILTANE